MKLKLFTFALLLVFSISLTSAIIINSVDVPPFSPGQEGQVRIGVENILNKDTDDVSLKLSFENLPFIPIGTSEQSIDEIEEDDEEDFVFRIKAATDINPGDYEIPYTLEYEIDGDSKTKTGTIGVRVEANPDLTFTIDTSDSIQNKQGRISFKIINKGFSDARFVSVRIIPDGYIATSEKEEYVGEVDSDDFETVNFDVLYTSTDATFFAIVEYRDFNNEKIIKNVELPITVFTQEQALKLGLIQPSKTASYITTAIVIIVIIIIWRWWKRRQKLRKIKKNQRE